MVRKSKLLAALDAHKGIDHKLERQKKLQKQAAKKKRLSQRPEDSHDDISVTGEIQAHVSNSQLEEIESDGWESDESMHVVHTAVDISHIDDSESESDESLQDIRVNQRLLPLASGKDEGHAHDKADEDDGIPLSDTEILPDDERDDLVPHQRLTINNNSALLKAYNSIALPLAKLPFSEHQTIISTEIIPIQDINDDLTRELAFYKQLLDAAQEARVRLRREGAPFSRPTDYFAEMVKSDEHMGKIKQKMTDEAANKLAAAEARKQRDLKKFGKQVQIAKLQERDKSKRETLDKINLLKRKRRDTVIATAQEEELFDVALEDASKAGKPAGSARNGARLRTQSKRQKKDGKFGFGGKKRFSKSGDAASSADLRGFSSKKMKGQKKVSQRLGKSKRTKQS